MKQVKCSLNDGQAAWLREQAVKEQCSESMILRRLVERERERTKVTA